MTMTVDQGAAKIHSLVNDQGFLGHDRNAHMHEVQEVLKQFGKADEGKVVAKLSDGDLRKLADNVNAGGILGFEGLSTGEKKDLFNNLATNLDGAQLGRIAKAFDSRGDVQALADSVATHGSSQSKVDFVKALATRATDGDSNFSGGIGGSTIEAGDKEAGAIGQVLASMKNDPAGFDQAVKALNNDQLAAVVKAGEGEVTRTTISSGGGFAPPTATSSTSYDPAQLRGVLAAAAASNDPAVKARVFEASAKALDDIRGNDTLLSPNPGANDAAKLVTEGMGKVLDSDPRGVVDRLNTDDVNGKALTTYLGEVIKANPSAKNTTLGNEIAALQGSGTGKSASDFINTAEKGANGDNFYRNAQNLGYYAGAMQAALNKMNASTKTQGDVLTNVFTTAVSAATTAITKMPTAGKVASQAFNGLTRAVVQDVVSDVTAGRKDLRDALTELALPRAAGQTDRSRGPADPYFASAANTVVLANQ